jgi:hypothetical protein
MKKSTNVGMRGKAVIHGLAGSFSVDAVTVFKSAVETPPTIQLAERASWEFESIRSFKQISKKPKLKSNELMLTAFPVSKLVSEGDEVKLTGFPTGNGKFVVKEAKQTGIDLRLKLKKTS